ncbi:hypothetical protein GCM10027056_31930 [Glaciibacter psychrotolerans]
MHCFTLLGKYEQPRQESSFGDERGAPTDADAMGVFRLPFFDAFQYTRLAYALFHEGNGVVVDNLMDSPAAHDLVLGNAA